MVEKDWGVWDNASCISPLNFQTVIPSVFSNCISEYILIFKLCFSTLQRWGGWRCWRIGLFTLQPSDTALRLTATTSSSLSRWWKTRSNMSNSLFQGSRRQSAVSKASLGLVRLIWTRGCSHITSTKRVCYQILANSFDRIDRQTDSVNFNSKVAIQLVLAWEEFFVA